MSIMESLDRLRGKVNTAIDLARREFWDKYQDNGKRTDYECAFYGGGWKNKRFNPYYPLGTEDYPIECATSMFSQSKITKDISVVLCDECEVYDMFFGSVVQDVSIRVLGALTDCEGMFFQAVLLVNLYFEGTIYSDFNLQWCSLSEDSLRSIVNALQDLTESGEVGSYTISFDDKSMDILQSTGLLNDLEAKGWNY